MTYADSAMLNELQAMYCEWQDDQYERQYTHQCLVKRYRIWGCD